MAKHDRPTATTGDAPDPLPNALRLTSDRPTHDRRRRLMDKDGSAEYLMVSTDTIERLIHAGMLPVVKLPVERGPNNRGRTGVSRRVLIDVIDLDRLIERSKETAAVTPSAVALTPRRRA